MIRHLAIIALCSGLSGCVSAGKPERRIVTFYKQALERARSGETATPVDLAGLKIVEGVLPGKARYPGMDESSLVVSDADPTEREAVVVIVSPRVPGSFLDPAQPSPEFQKQYAADQEEALRRNRYTGVFLVPRP